MYDIHKNKGSGSTKRHYPLIFMAYVRDTKKVWKDHKRDSRFTLCDKKERMKMFGFLKNLNKERSAGGKLNPRDGIVLKIEGMTCGHCKSSVEKALLKVPGVKQAEVDLAHKQAIVIGSVDRSLLKKAVNEAGFRALNN